MTFTQPEIDYLHTQDLGRLATVQSDGTLQVSPVGFRYNAELTTIDIASAPDGSSASASTSPTAIRTCSPQQAERPLADGHAVIVLDPHKLGRSCR